MDLLQKITLYDLLGYMLPGCVFLFVLRLPEVGTLKGKMSIYIVLFIVSGYLLGILISEAASFLLKKWSNSDTARQMTEEKIKIDRSLIRKALKKAKVLKKGNREAAEELMWKYHTYMHMDIQADSRYSRIHNYASAELLYKNMALVSVLCAMIFCVRHQCCEAGIGVISAAFFLMRWWRFAQKREIYTVYWFVGKYIDK